MAFVSGIVDNVSTTHLPALTEMAEMELAGSIVHPKTALHTSIRK